MYNNLLFKAEAFVRNLLTNQLDPIYRYHDLAHTLSVTANCRMLCENCGVIGEDAENAILATLFHDTGFTKTVLGHEEESCKIASEYFTNEGIDADRVRRILALILVTKKGATPANQLEAIVADADLLQLGQKGFRTRSNLLREELELIHNKKISDAEWAKGNIEFLTNHNFYTQYAREKFGPRKAQNLQKQIQKLKGLNESTVIEKLTEAAEAIQNLPEEKGIAGVADKILSSFGQNEREAAKKQLKLTGKSTNRGVETLFRNLTRVHIDLSANADRKANMMISVNSILISILISTLVGRLAAFPHLTAPTIIILSVCMISLGFAIMSSRPNVSKGVVSREDIENRRGNLLFFGNFYNMSLDDYTFGMERLMMDAEYLYGSMIRDVYYLGVVLERKYKFLRYSYDVFGIGLLISVLSFIAAVILA